MLIIWNLSKYGNTLEESITGDYFTTILAKFFLSM